MSKLWVFTASEYSGDISARVVVKASTKAEVGKFVKNNTEKFHDLFKLMKYCDEYEGKVRKVLYPEQGLKYPKLDAREALSVIPDDKIVDEFWAYIKDSESSAVNVSRIDEENIEIA
jgi:hypothetical protein